jgi:hypothetical protein
MLFDILNIFPATWASAGGRALRETDIPYFYTPCRAAFAALGALGMSLHPSCAYAHCPLKALA